MMLRAALCLHVLATIGLFVVLAFEWVWVVSVRESGTFEEARAVGRLARLLTPVGAPATLLVLATGVYLATTLNLWVLPWVKVAVPTLVVVAVAGGLVGGRRRRARTALEQGEGALPEALRAMVRHRAFVGSLFVRSALLVGLVLLMTIKP